MKTSWSTWFILKLDQVNRCRLSLFPWKYWPPPHLLAERKWRCLIFLTDPLLSSPLSWPRCCIPESVASQTHRHSRVVSHPCKQGSPLVRGPHPATGVSGDARGRPLEDEGACSKAAGAYTCVRCGKAYSHMSGLSRHKRQCEGRVQRTCEICARHFYRCDNYKYHMTAEHGVQVDADPVTSHPVDSSLA